MELEDIWPCNCPICRVLVKPLVSIIARRSNLGYSFSTRVGITEPGEGMANMENSKDGSIQINNPDLRELAQRYPVKVAKVSSGQSESLQPPIENPILANQTSQLQPNPQEFESIAQEQTEEGENEEYSPQKIQVEVPKEVLERINSLEAEVDKMKKYVKQSIDSIKATLIDLRSAMAELSNPFNILRKYADIFFGSEEEGKERSNKELKETEHQTQPVSPQIIPIIVPSPVPIQGNNYQQDQVLNMVQNSTSTTVTQTANSGQEETGESSGTTRKQGMTRGNSKKISIDVYEKLVDWANNVLNRIGRDKFSKLIDYYTDIGLIEEDMGNALKKIVEIVNELRSANIDPKEQVELLRELLSGVNGSKPSTASTEREEEKEEKESSSVVEEVKEEAGTPSPSEAAKELLDIIGEGGDN